MQLNKIYWNLYKQSEEGKTAIKLFEEGPIDRLLEKYLGVFDYNANETTGFVDDLIDFTTTPIIPEQLSKEEAEAMFNLLCDEGITMIYEDGEQDFYLPTDLLFSIPVISTWLYTHSDFYKPYFFRNRFQLLTRIADSFGIILPPVPLKRYKAERLKYYWLLCQSFLDFQEKNDLTAAEFCAFLYDFAPKDIEQNDVKNQEDLPRSSQVWMIGGNKGGSDFEFLDNATDKESSFWQGNEDTKRGDILVMYCLAPHSYIHSIWRATADGITDPFFHWYSSIYIGEGRKIKPITINELKGDSYFSTHKLVRKNLQGVSGYPLTSQDYSRLQQMILEKGGEITDLPQLYSHSFSANENLADERDVEISLIEPLLIKLGYNSSDWVRQLSVRMGRGERNYPDYTFLVNKKKGYETASMLIESKFFMKSNREIDDAFEQVRSYGLRLSAKTLVIVDKDSIRIYKRQKNDGFDRTEHVRKSWVELQQPDSFNFIQKLIGKK